MIFAREINDPLTSLVKKLDAEVAKNKSAKVKSAVVMLTDDEGMEKKLKELNEKQGIKHVSLGVDNPAGPAKWKVAKEADVTVVLYTKRQYTANHAFRKGALNDQAIEKILADLPKIIPGK
jgi:L-lactate utilization protein LutC